MTAVKIRRGVVAPMAVFTLVVLLVCFSGSKPAGMASQLKQLGFGGYQDPESLDDEGDTSAERIAQFLSEEVTFGGASAKAGADPGQFGEEVGDPAAGTAGTAGTAAGGSSEVPIYHVEAKPYPSVPAPNKNNVGNVRFRFYSHNLKNGAHSDLVKGEVAWAHRRSHVVSSIKAHTPANSIVTLQEPVKFQLDEVMASLNRYSGEQPEWTAYGGGRIDGAEDGEFVPILVRTAEWEVVYDDTFWLNQKDERSSYTGWDGKYPRIATYVTLKHRQSGTYINVFNTHFDHKGVVARTESAELLMRKMASLNGWPSFLLGDLNAVPNDASYKTLASQYADTHTLVNSENRYGHHEWTVTGFSGDFAADAKRIDYIFAPADVKREWEPVCEGDRAMDLRLRGYGLMHSKFGGVYMSDHRPLVADYEVHKC